MVERKSVPEGALPIAPSLAPIAPRPPTRVVDRRVVWVSALAMAVAALAACIAQLLTGLIHLVTNLAFYGAFSSDEVSPADNHLGLAVIFIPALGGLIVGLMARYGSQAIRGHGIPEAMEQVLTNQSRIPVRMTFLKPLSAAISIGTGGPFGAEGPIIATGGALGSVVGQFLPATAGERKTLLAAGAAAGMAATFGSPVSAVLLAIELLLFEYRSRSLVPVALAASVATGIRMGFVGDAPTFAMSTPATPSGAALCAYIGIGAAIGLASVGVTRAVYAVEDGFERLPIHWMWWPPLGGLVVGLVGYFAPRTMGVGYDNIEDMLTGDLTLATIAVLCSLKFVSWAFSLGSGTSGGTLAPLLTVGGGLGAVMGSALHSLVPELGIEVTMAVLVGMAAMFAGASRALLASIVFAFEVTRQPIGLLPLLGGCTAAFLVSALAMENSIMTEKIARRGVRAIGEYSADFLDQVSVASCAVERVVTLNASQPLGEVRAWLASGATDARHQGFPILDGDALLIGVLTRRDLLDADHADATCLDALIQRPAVVVHEDTSLRHAADQMAWEHIGRLPVVRRSEPRKVIGILSRSDLLRAHVQRLEDQHVRRRTRPRAPSAGV